MMFGLVGAGGSPNPFAHPQWQVHKLGLCTLWYFNNLFDFSTLVGILPFLGWHDQMPFQGY
jgi:hypothetical protein